jgi:pimeloyl-ACP methyl ester carboxylesterase
MLHILQGRVLLITVVVDGDISSMLKFNSESFYILLSFQFHFSPAVIRSWWYFFANLGHTHIKWAIKSLRLGFKIKLFSKKNVLNYTIYENQNSTQWVTFVHGAGEAHQYGSNKGFKKRYNVLLLDLRGHGILNL